MIRSKLFFVFAMGSAFTFAIHNYMIAYGMKWRNDASLAFPECFVFMLIGIVYHTRLAIISKKKEGRYFVKEKSILYDTKTKKFHLKNFGL